MISSDITNRGVRMTSAYTAVILHVTLYFYFTVNSFLELIPYLCPALECLVLPWSGFFL